MLNRFSVDANSLADANKIPQNKLTVENLKSINPDDLEIFQPLSVKRDIAPVAQMPGALDSNPGFHSLRRVLSREQGRALELIGHAVDYLNDCYLFEGEDSEIINAAGPSGEAIQILVSMRWQVLQEIPFSEPRSTRLWNALFHRNIKNRPGVVFQRSGDQGSKGTVLPLRSFPVTRTGH